LRPRPTEIKILKFKKKRKEKKKRQGRCCKGGRKSQMRDFSTFPEDGKLIIEGFQMKQEEDLQPVI